MNTAKKINQQQFRFASKTDLFSIESIEIKLSGNKNLSFLARTYLAFFVQLVKNGFSGIRCANAVIAHAQWLATGYSKTARSCSRAISELEKNGYLRVQRCRIGNESKINVIHFVESSFSFFTRKKHQNIIPLPGKIPDKKQTYIAPHQTDVPSYDFVNNNKEYNYNPNNCFNSNNNSKNNANLKNNAKKPDTKKPDTKKRVDPRLYSLGCVLRKQTQTGKLDRLNGRKIYIKFQSLLENNDERIGKYTIEYWFGLTFEEREYIAETIFIDFANNGIGKNKFDIDFLIKNVEKRTEIKHDTKTENDKLTQTQIRELLEKNFGKYDFVTSANNTKTEKLDGDDLEILLRAKEKIEQKRALRIF